MDWNSPTPYVAIGATVAVLSLGRLIYRAHIEKAEERGRNDKSVKELKKSNANIEHYLRRLFEHFVKRVVEGHSPVQLNELGKAVSEHLGAKDWARQEASKLQPQFKGQEAFEIYETVQLYVQDDSRFSEDFQRKMRKTAYEKNVEMIHIQAVLAIELRDALVDRLPD